MDGEALWIVRWRGGAADKSVTPPEWGDQVKVVVSGPFAVVVEAPFWAVERQVARARHWVICGHPADGRWVNDNGEEFFVAFGERAAIEECAEAFELTPKHFGASTWAAVDTQELRAAIPTRGAA